MTWSPISPSWRGWPSISQTRGATLGLHYDPKGQPDAGLPGSGRGSGTVAGAADLASSGGPACTDPAAKIGPAHACAYPRHARQFPRIDVHNRNNLVNTLLGTDVRPSVDWPVTNLDWTHGGGVPPPSPSAAEIGRAYSRAVAHFIDDPELYRTLSRLGEYLVSYHGAKCWSDFQVFERHIRSRPMGDMLVSGTPKHLGRLAGWFYRRDGKEVIRCAHGGERAFFPIRNGAWPNSGLRHLLRPQRAGNATPSPGGWLRAAPNWSSRIATSPSRLSEARITRTSCNAPAHCGARGKTGTIVYVAGGYLGEQLGDFPNRKPPDPLYLDWQIDLIRALKALGYRVAVKLHPAGIAQDARYLAHYADAILRHLRSGHGVGGCLHFRFCRNRILRCVGHRCADGVRRSRRPPLRPDGLLRSDPALPGRPGRTG